MTSANSISKDSSNEAKAPAKYRMIAIDFDGTLLSPQGVVSDRTKLAIQRALSAGLLICFATGRTLVESQFVLDAVAHYEAGVFAGGAVVIHPRENLTLHRAMMQPALAARVCAFFENLEMPAMALQDLSQTDVHYLVSAKHELDPGTQIWMKKHEMNIRRVENLGEHPHPHTVRVGVCDRKAKTAEALTGLVKTFGEEIVCHGVGVIGHDMEVLEVFDPAVNKWQGILHVARHYGVDASEIIAIGDDRNDLPMIRGAGLGVAMGNAHPQVIAAAGRVIGHNADDGLAEFLDELVAQHKVQPIDEQTKNAKDGG